MAVSGTEDGAGGGRRADVRGDPSRVISAGGDFRGGSGGYGACDARGNAVDKSESPHVGQGR